MIERNGQETEKREGATDFAEMNSPRDNARQAFKAIVQIAIIAVYAFICWHIAGFIDSLLQLP